MHRTLNSEKLQFKKQEYKTKKLFHGDKNIARKEKKKYTNIFIVISMFLV